MTTVDFEITTLRPETRDLWVAAFTSQMRALGTRGAKATLEDLGRQLYDAHNDRSAQQVALDGIFNGAPWVLRVAGRPGRKVGGDSVI